MDNLIIAALAFLATSVACGIISVPFFKNRQRLILQSLPQTSKKQVLLGNIHIQALCIGTSFGSTLAMPFFVYEVLRSTGFEAPFTPEFIAVVAFICMLFAWFVLLRAFQIRIITNDVLITSKYLGFGEVEKYPIKELRRRESMEKLSKENPTVTLHIRVYHENKFICIVRPEFDENKKKELLLELLRQIPEQKE